MMYQGIRNSIFIENGNSSFSITKYEMLGGATFTLGYLIIKSQIYESILPKGNDVPYEVNDAPIGTEHTLLSQEAKRLYLFTKGGDNALTQNKRETLFIQMLEGLSAEEAKFLITVVNKRVNNEYKGFTSNLVKEAFNWNDNFMKNE